jgi:hypothetical protein
VKTLSKYTTTIYNILQNIVPNSENLTPDELVEQGVNVFFDFSFPWYNETGDGKSEFMTAYLTRYLNNEIGQETLGMHKQFFKGLMYENVEEMRQKYSLLGDMPNVAGERRVNNNENINDTETSNTDAKQGIVSTDVSNQKQNSQSIHSDNPQVTISTNDYASEMDRGEATTNNNTNSTSNSTGQTDSNRVGNTKRTLSENVTDTRNSDKYFSAISEGAYLINTILLKRCRKLFMQVW